MNKKFLFNLSKIANHLDEKGLVKEANAIDNVLIKIAQRTGKQDYNNDINEYKNLILNKKFTEAEEFLDKVIEQYTDIPTRDAFLSQARRIQNEQQHVNIKEKTISNDDLYKLITKYKLDQAKDLNSFNIIWQKMTNDLEKNKSIDYNENIILTSAYRNLTSKFTRPFESKVTGDYNTDIQFYKTLITNNLFDQANKFLQEILKSYYEENTKDMFSKDAERIKLVYDKNNFFEDGTYIGINEDYLNDDLNYFGILQADNQEQFEQNWSNFINYLKTIKFKHQNNPNAKYIYEYPTVRQQLQLLKDKLLLSKNFNNTK